MFACVGAHACVQVYANACGGPRIMSRNFLDSFLLYSLRKALSRPEVPQEARSQKSPCSGAPLSLFSMDGNYRQAAHLSGISVVSGDLKLDLHIFMASIYFFLLSHLHRVQGNFFIIGGLYATSDAIFSFFF